MTVHMLCILHIGVTIDRDCSLSDAKFRLIFSWTQHGDYVYTHRLKFVNTAHFYAQTTMEKYQKAPLSPTTLIDHCANVALFLQF